MGTTLGDIVAEQLDAGRPDDDGDGRETIDNRERGCGHLKATSAYVRCDVAALSAKGGELPRFVELDDPVEYREHTGKGAIIPGYLPFPGNSFGDHYVADGRSTTPAGDIDAHAERLRRHGFDGDHYGDITSAHAIDLLMSVGKSHWSTPEEYIDECRDRGLNLKIPVSDRQEPPTVEPLRTRVWVIHPHGCGDGRPGIVGYSYLTRTVFTTGTKATADDPDIPSWAEDYAASGKFDVVDRGEPISAEDAEKADSHVPLDDFAFGGDGSPEDDSQERDVATVTTSGDTRAATGIEIEFGRGDISVTDRRASFDAATDDGALPYNALKVVASNRDDVDVGPTPGVDDLITALSEGGYAFVPAYHNPNDGDGGDE